MTKKRNRFSPAPGGAQAPLLALLLLLALSLAGCSGLREIIRPRPTLTPTPSSTAALAPLLTVQPDTGAPGLGLAVRGEGWRPGDIVFIRLRSPLPDPNAIPDKAVAVATVQDDGRFLTGFVFPNETPWSLLPSVLITAQSQATGETQTITLPVRSAVPSTTPTSPALVTATPTPGAITATPTPYVITATPTPYVITATPTPYVITATPTPTSAPPTSTPTPAPGATATPTVVVSYWRGEYYANKNLLDNPVLIRNDASIFFNWGNGAVAPGLPADNFSIRWTRALTFDQGVYRFHIVVDDGARFFVDGALLLDQWKDGSRREFTVDYPMPAGVHALRLEYYEAGGDALAQLWWEIAPAVTNTPTHTPRPTMTPTRRPTNTPARTRTPTPTRTRTPTPRPLPTSTIEVRPTSTPTLPIATIQPLPTDTPTALPTDTPTALPTNTPTALPTDTPTALPTDTPTALPTDTPTALPTDTPTALPTDTPTALPTDTPTALPTDTPTALPTDTPTTLPTDTPTALPTDTPTALPTDTPTPRISTAVPTVTATRTPTPRISTAVPTVTATRTPTPPVFLLFNELLAVPRRIDWNHDGRINDQDEWIELYNPTNVAVSLSGWYLDTGRNTTSYRLPRSAVAPANGYLLFFRKTTGLALNDRGGSVRLLRPDRSVAVSLTFPALKPDASFSRDSGGGWHSDWPPTPGRANESSATPPPVITTMPERRG